MTRKQAKPEDIEHILKKVIKKIGAKGRGSIEEVVQAWQGAIETGAVAHTKPVALKKNILTIEVDSSTWLYFLSLKKKSILTKMEKALGKAVITDIKFRIGEIS